MYTAREHLVLLADIRGVPKHLVSRVVERAIVDMSLTEKVCLVRLYSTHTHTHKHTHSMYVDILYIY